jgi:multiple sugar transport system substrate-binding protein
MTEKCGRRTLVRAAAAGVAVALALSACSSSGSPGTTTSTSGPAQLTLWALRGNAPAESQALQSAVTSFNASQTAAKVTITFIPEKEYPTQVAAAGADQLPDILEVDGPTVAARLRENKLIDLSGLLSPATINNLTGPIRDEGTIGGKLYAVAQFNAGLGVYGNKKLLDAAGVKYPTSLKDDWTAEQFTTALKTLAARNTVMPGKALDAKLNYVSGGLTGEFGTFAYSPLLWSAGADLMRDGRAAGVLNSDAAVKVLQTVASWRPFVSADTDDRDFVSGKVPLSWVGHWAFPDYSKALGKDLVVLPLPDFGKGPKMGAGSWAWGVTPRSKHPKQAAAFLDYLLNDQNIAAMVAVNGGLPGTTSSLSASSLYKPGGPLALWGEAMNAAPGTACVAGTAIPDSCVAIVRPLTAGYPKVTKEFAYALDDIFKGAPAKARLDKAAEAIDTDFADHNDYR